MLALVAVTNALSLDVADLLPSAPVQTTATGSMVFINTSNSTESSSSRYNMSQKETSSYGHTLVTIPHALLMLAARAGDIQIEEFLSYRIATCAAQQ